MWYKIILSVDDITSGAQFYIMEQFNKIFMFKSAPLDMALFSTGAEKMIETGEVIIFFSPGSISWLLPLIQEFKGTESLSPKSDAVSLLIGHSSAWELLK